MTYHTVLACDTQLKMMPFGLDNLVLIGKHFLSSSFFPTEKYFICPRSYGVQKQCPYSRSKKLTTKKERIKLRSFMFLRAYIVIFYQ